MYFFLSFFEHTANVYLEDNVTENKSVQLMGSVLSSNGDFFIVSLYRAKLLSRSSGWERACN